MAPISGLILAGGRGQRMGGVDKGLQLLSGRPVIAHVIERFGPQVSELIISANRNADEYARHGYAVVGDELGAGPLAGLHAGLRRARHELIATAPCDAPALPLDLVQRLRAALDDSHADVAVATTAGRSEPVFILARKSVLSHLSAYLEQGGRTADGWYAGVSTVSVPFDDQAAAFANLNCAGDFTAFERGV